MTALLTDNLPLLAGAPNGIKKLRELILELAVRGKLVPQDPSDEPASELLRRIAEEKARLVAEGKIKKQKPLTERDDEAPEIELPAGWAWARLSNVVNVLNGRAYKKEELLDAGTPVLRVGNLFTSNHWYHSNLTLEEDKYCNPGDLLFAWSASFGPFIWQGERSIYHYHIWKLDFYAQGQLSKHYLYNFLLEQTQEIKAAGHGVSMVHMTKEKMEKLVVPVPPLAEQHRIVAKVDELMALCDRLEAQQADAENAHAQLVQALLGSLTQAADAGDFAASWQRLAEHFHTLFTTESSIDALKQSLLQLAVMGKLVPQDPNDEPASELLQRIAVERLDREGSRRSKSQVELREIDGSEKKFELPAGWEWVRLQQIVSVSSGDGLVSAKMNTEGSVPVYGGNGVTGHHDRQNVEKETLVIGRVGYYCGSIHLTPASAWVTDNALIVRFSERNIDKSFLFWLLKGTNLKEQENATAQPVISGRKIYPIVLAIPPLAEQRRIVAKLNQLMVLCDQLKTRLTQARRLNEQLATALVEQAVA